MSLVPYDLAVVLQPYGIKELLNVICSAYFQLCSDDIVNIEMEEIQISEELFIRVQEYFYNYSIPLKIKHIDMVPVYEKHVPKLKTIGKFPSIDICFRDKYNPEIFFGAECKILNDNKVEYYSRYISQGVDRYLTGKYYGYSSHSSMIGYILKGTNKKILTELNKRMTKKTNTKLVKSFDLGKFKEHYISNHKLKTHSKTLHHLLISFV